MNIIDINVSTKELHVLSELLFETLLTLSVCLFV